MYELGSWTQHFLLTRAMEEFDSLISRKILYLFLSNREKTKTTLKLKISEVKKYLYTIKGGIQHQEINSLFDDNTKKSLQKMFQSAIINIDKDYIAEEVSKNSLDLDKVPHYVDEEGIIRFYNIQASIIKTILIDETKDEMRVRFNEDLIPFLDPISRYVYISLEKIIKLKSKYAVSLYKYCLTKLEEHKTNVINNYRVYIYKTESNPDENLETWLKIDTKGAYKYFSKIEQKILIPAITEINEAFKTNKELYIDPQYRAKRGKYNQVEYITLSFKRYNEKFDYEEIKEKNKKELDNKISYEDKESQYFIESEKLLEELSKNTTKFRGEFDEEYENIIEMLRNINQQNTLDLKGINELIMDNNIFNKYCQKAFIRIGWNYDKWKFLIIRKVILASSMKEKLSYKEVCLALSLLIMSCKDIEENFKDEKKIFIEL